MPRRSAVAGTALALLVAATGCGAKDGPESTRPAAAAGAAKAGVMHHISIDYAAPEPGVTHEQAIRAMVQPPAVKGYVLGTVTSAGTVVTVDEARFTVECTDYDFTVTRFVGPDPAPYSPPRSRCASPAADTPLSTAARLRCSRAALSSSSCGIRA